MLDINTPLKELKAKADELGINYGINIGQATLYERIVSKMDEAKLNQTTTENERVTESKSDSNISDTKENTVAKESVSERNMRLRKESQQLVRCRIMNMNPDKKDYPGEVFTISNRVIGTVKKYIPYNIDEPYHIPKIIFDHLKEKECRVKVTMKNHNGEKFDKQKIIKEFALEELPPLTKEELKDLAKQQALAKGQG